MEMIKKLLFSATLILLFSSSSFASSLPDFPFIGVKGVAEIEVAPDVVAISFELLEFNEKPDEALQNIKNRSSQIVKLAREFGVADNAIISTSINSEIVRQVNREHGYDQTNILGYEITQDFTIDIEDLSIYSMFVDKLISVGNVNRVYPKFDIANRKETLRDLVKKAGEDARNNADDLANAMGVKIKSVYAINQDSSFENFFASFGLQEVAPSTDREVMTVTGRRGSISLNMMVPKSIKLSKRIGVVYKIR